MAVKKSRILDAVAALEAGERRRAAALIAQELRAGEQTGDRWGSVSKLATKIGEIDLGIEASRRFAMSEPISLDRLLGHCGSLAQVGRSEQGIELLDRLPPQAQEPFRPAIGIGFGFAFAFASPFPVPFAGFMVFQYNSMSFLLHWLA